MVRRDLFGGAIAVDNFPENVIDASDLRQIPDNQEVFLFPNSSISIIIEILERVPELNDTEAARFHFDALAHDNDAISHTMETPSVMPNNRANEPLLITLRGSQRICKFNRSDGDDVDILVALFRVQAQGKSADVVVSENIPKDEEDGVKKHAATAFNSLVSSFRIIDYNLFVDSGDRTVSQTIA